jgi:hypothetical protein
MGLWGVATSRGADLEPREGSRSVLARSGAAINAVIVHAVAPVLGDEGVPTLGSTAIMRWETVTPGRVLRRAAVRAAAWGPERGQSHVLAHRGRPRPGQVPQAL